MLQCIILSDFPEGTPLYKPYTYVPPQMSRAFQWFLCHFGVKTGMEFRGQHHDSRCGKWYFLV